MKYKRSSVILVFNGKGELALQLRSGKDNAYPLHWDFSAAGGIDQNEDSKKAAMRELFEELGIEAEVEFVGKEVYIDEKAQDELHIYRAYHNGPFSPDSTEVEEIKFFSLEKIGEMLKSGVKFHPEFPFLWDKGVIKP